MYAIPFHTMQGGTLDRLAFEVVDAGNPGSDCRINLYTSTSLDANDFYPLDRILPDLGGLNATVPGVKSYTIDQEIVPNTVLWVVFCCGVTPPTIKAFHMAACIPMIGTDISSGVFLTPSCGWRVNFSYGSFPSTFPAGGTPLRIDTLPAIAYRYSS
jgi:hypothetical protein